MNHTSCDFRQSDATEEQRCHHPIGEEARIKSQLSFLWWTEDKADYFRFLPNGAVLS